jgi:hypothetical protein
MVFQTVPPDDVANLVDAYSVLIDDEPRGGSPGDDVAAIVEIELKVVSGLAA